MDAQLSKQLDRVENKLDAVLNAVGYDAVPSVFEKCKEALENTA